MKMEGRREGRKGDKREDREAEYGERAEKGV